MSIGHRAGRDSILPTTRLGRWAVVWFGLLVGSFVFMNVMVISGQRGGDTLFDNVLLGIPALVGALSATLSAATGIAGVVRSHERSASALICTSLSTLVFEFIALTLLLGD